MLRGGQRAADCPGVQLRVHRLKTMVRVCVYPNCKNRMSRNTPHSFHRLPLSNCEMLKLWLIVLQLDANTPVQTLRLADHRVCSAHFSQDDYCQAKKRKHPIPKHFFLKKTSVPRLEKPVKTLEQPAGTSSVSSCGAETRPAAGPQLQDTQAVMDKSDSQDRTTDDQADSPETLTVTMEKPTRHHIVDEEAILQLMKNCPMCDRKCRCSKRTHGPYLVVYQSCYFCHYQRKWASQPEARNMNTSQTAPKRKPKPKNKVSGNAKSSSQVNKTNVTESS